MNRLLKLLSLLVIYNCSFLKAAADHCGHTLLHSAASLGHTEIVHDLLDAGACPNQIDSLGETPLFGAVNCGNVEIIRELLAAGARTDIINKTGKTVHSIALKWGNRNVVRLIYSWDLFIKSLKTIFCRSILACYYQRCGINSFAHNVPQNILKKIILLLFPTRDCVYSKPDIVKVIFVANGEQQASWCPIS